MTNKRKDWPVPRRGREKVAEIFGADLRSLAAFRIVLAILVLADLVSRASDLSAHYTDGGVLPRSVLQQEVLSRWAFSLNLVNGEAFFQALLFLITALATLGLLVGYRTRLASVIVWVLLLSIQMRNPLVNNAGADLLRLLLFWGMFLPLGAWWSVDRMLKSTPRISMRFLSVATFALFMQIAFVYWFTAAFKSGVTPVYPFAQEWHVDGTAIYHALSADQFATPIGAYLLNFPELLKMLTIATFWFEVFGPLLLFVPFFTGPVRTGVILAFMALHFGIWLTMYIGLFPWVSAFCMVCFLPSWFWDRTLPKLRAALLKQPNLARRLQRLASRLVNAYWLPLRSRLAPKGGMERPSVAGLEAQVDDDERLGSQTRHDSVVGSTPAAVSAEPATLRSSAVTDGLALLFVLYIFFWNITTIAAIEIPEEGAALGRFLGLNQYWNMYATPYNDGWYVVPGTLRNGEQVDLIGAAIHSDFSLREASWEKPENVRRTIKNEHWRKYLSDIQGNKTLLLYFGHYICREWNARHAEDEQLLNLQITFMSEETPLPGYQPATPEERVLWKHNCFRPGSVPT